MPLNKSDQSNMIREFRNKYLFNVDELKMSNDRILENVLLHNRLFLEEYTEFWEAYYKNDKIEMLDAVTDCLYILAGCEVHISLNKAVYPFFNSMVSMFENVRNVSGFTDDQINEAFEIVHTSNMSKGVELDNGNIYPIWENLNPTNKDLYNNFVMDYLRGGDDLTKWAEMEKGKLMKGDTFTPPDLSNLI
jgi:hypothetical protein